MEYNVAINSYNQFYEDKYDKIEKACNCIDKNSSVHLKECIERLRDELTKKLSNLNWDDQAKIKFDENLKICEEGFTDINNHITNNFQVSETIYRDTKIQLNDLKKSIDNLLNESNNKPKESDFLKTIISGIGTESIVDNSSFTRALNNWKVKCDNFVKTCDNIIETINDNLNELKKIDDLSFKIKVVSNMSFSSFKIGGNASQFAYYTDNADSVLNSGSVEYTRTDGKLTIRYNQGKQSEWNKTIDGVNLHSAGCGIMSIATALTSAYTYQAGHDVTITPIDVANALNDYSLSKGGSGLSGYFPNGMGSYNGLTNAVSEIYGVDIMYRDSNVSSQKMTNIQVKNSTSESGTVIYSLVGKGHIAAVTDVKENGNMVIADTGSGKAKYIYGTNNFDGGKRSMIVTYEEMGISGNKITRNGKIQMNDLGDMKEIVIKGKSYNISRQQVNGTDLYEYIIV